MDWAWWHVWGRREIWQGLMENREGRRPVRRRRRGWMGGIQMDLKLYSLPPVCGNGITRGQQT